MTVENGVIQQLSVSQVESFELCPRLWWFNVVNGLRPKVMTNAQSDGDKGHALFERWFRYREMPGKKVKMGTVVTRAIVKGDLPEPGPDMLVEERFDGQPKFGSECTCGHTLVGHEFEKGVYGRCLDDKCMCAGGTPRWLPLDKANTFWLGGVPWEGFIDLAFRRGDIPTILDHKFTSDLTFAKKPSELIKTVQMPVYALSRLPYWPDATRFELAHHYVCRTGDESSLRSRVVDLSEVYERKTEIEATVERMKVVAKAEKQGDVHGQSRGPKRACEKWTGCPHQSICSAFKERPAMNLTAEEAALFDELDAPGSAAAMTPPPAAPVAPPAPAVAAAPAPEAKPRRRILIADVPATPTAAAAASVSASVICACSATLTAENSSTLRSGEVKHIGCPLSVLPPDAPPSKPELAAEPPSKPELAAEQPAQPAPPKEKKTKAKKTEPEVLVYTPSPEADPTPPLVTSTSLAPVLTVNLPRALAVAEVLESVARLLRAD